MPMFGLVTPHPDRRALAGGANTGEGIITRIISAIENPFHGSRRVVNLDNRQAVIGSIVDGHGNVVGRYEPPGGHGSETGERAFHGMMVQAHMQSRMDGPIYLDDGDDNKVAFGTDHETIARHSALAAAGSRFSFGSTGEPVEIRAKEVVEAIGKFMSDSLKAAAEKIEAFGGDEPVSLDEGWPDNGSEGTDTPEQTPSDATPANTTGAAVQGPETVSDEQAKRQAFEAAGGKLSGMDEVAAPPVHSPEHTAQIQSTNVPGLSPPADSPATEQAAEKREPEAAEGEVAMQHSQADRSNDRGGHDNNAA